MGDQVVFGPFQGSLQIALHGGHVVDRLGHHAGEFLHAGKAVKLQRVEGLTIVLRVGHARLHLRLRLHLHITQLLPQALQISVQFTQPAAHLNHACIESGAADHHFAGLIHQAVQQQCTHAHGLTRHAAQGGARCAIHVDRKRHGRCRPNFRRGGCHGSHCVFSWLGSSLCLGRSFILGFSLGRLADVFTRGQVKSVQGGLQIVQAGQQRLQLHALQSFRPQGFDTRFHAVRHFAQAHGTGQTRAALQGVQHAQCFRACAEILRTRHPLAQSRAQGGHQFKGFFLEYREQVGVQMVDRIDVVLGRVGDLQWSRCHREGRCHVKFRRRVKWRGRVR